MLLTYCIVPEVLIKIPTHFGTFEQILWHLLVFLILRLNFLLRKCYSLAKSIVVAISLFAMRGQRRILVFVSDPMFQLHLVTKAF